MGILEQQSVKDKIISLRGQDVILDFAVAEIYGVETREINQAVRNNPKSRTIPKAFTEKGLYMLATILKGERAVQATIAITSWQTCSVRNCIPAGLRLR